MMRVKRTTNTVKAAFSKSVSWISIVLVGGADGDGWRVTWPVLVKHIAHSKHKAHVKRTGIRSASRCAGLWATARAGAASTGRTASWCSALHCIRGCWGLLSTG